MNKKTLALFLAVLVFCSGCAVTLQKSNLTNEEKIVKISKKLGTLMAETNPEMVGDVTNFYKKLSLIENEIEYKTIALSGINYAINKFTDNKTHKGIAKIFVDELMDLIQIEYDQEKINMTYSYFDRLKLATEAFYNGYFNNI